MFGKDKRVTELENELAQTKQRLADALRGQASAESARNTMWHEVRAVNAALVRKNYSNNRMREIIKSYRKAENAKTKDQPSKSN